MKSYLIGKEKTSNPNTRNKEESKYFLHKSEKKIVENFSIIKTNM